VRLGRPRLREQGEDVAFGIGHCQHRHVVRQVGQTLAQRPAPAGALLLLEGPFAPLRPLGVEYINMPLSPMRVWEAISDAKGGAA